MSDVTKHIDELRLHAFKTGQDADKEAYHTALSRAFQNGLLVSCDAVDYPELDATDGAHPAWWRGHEHTAEVFCKLVNEILDGKPLGGGIAGQPWEDTRRRLEALVRDQIR